LKDIVVLGGPNGAGKTTAAAVLLPAKLGIVEFVNADEIAKGLSPFAPEQTAVAAVRIMLGRMHALIEQGSSFAFETTCAGRGHATLLRQCKARGWRLDLLYLWLPSPKAALERVERRVKEGGHNIPANVVERRYWSGLSNMLRLYLPLADVAAIYDNSDEGRTLVAEVTPDSGLVVHDTATWDRMAAVNP
jgi:predicted ABC-type ATPase